MAAFGSDNRVIKIILQAVDMASDVLEKTQRGWKGLTGFLKKEWDDTGASARKLLGEFKGILNNSLVQGVGFAGLIAGLKKSWDAADSFEASLRKLEGTAKITGVPLETLQAIAAKGKDEFGLSSMMANDFAVELAKLAAKAGDVGKASPALAAFLDIGSARGLGAADTLKAVQQAILGIDEGTDKLFNANPSVLYKEYADSIGVAVGKLTDQQKAEAIVVAALRDGEKVRGAYAEYLESNAGKQEQMRIKVEEATVALGQSTQTIRDLVVPGLAWVAEKVVEFIGGWQLLWVDAAIATESLGPAMRNMAGGVLMTLSELIGESRIVLTLFGDSATDLADRMGDAGVRMKTGAEKDKRNLEKIREEMYAEVVGITMLGEKKVTTVTRDGSDQRGELSEEEKKRREKVAKDQASELERINTDLAVKLLQIEKGWTEKQAQEFIRRRGILTGENTRLVTTLTDGYAQLDRANSILAAGFDKQMVPAIKNTERGFKALTEVAIPTGDAIDLFERRVGVTAGTIRKFLEGEAGKGGMEGLPAIVRDGATAAAGLGSALGVVSQETAGAITQVVSLGDALIRAQGNPAALVGVVGGLAGMIGSALAGQSEVKRIMDANTRSHQDNTRALGDLTRMQSSGHAIQGVSSVLGGLDWQKLSGMYDASPALGDKVLRQTLARDLMAQGLGIGDLETLAKDLGITITDSKGRLVPQAVRQILDALAGVEPTRFGTDWTSQVGRIRTGRDIGAIGEGQEFGELAQVLSSLGVTGITDLIESADLSSAEGRTALADQLRNLFTRLNDGSLDVGAFGKLTGSQFVDAITQLIGILDDSERTIDTGFTLGTSPEPRAIDLAIETGLGDLVSVGDETNLLLTDIRDSFRTWLPSTSLPAATDLLGAMGGVEVPAGSAVGGIDLSGDINVTVNVSASGGDPRAIGDATRVAVAEVLDEELARMAADARTLRGEMGR